MIKHIKPLPISEEMLGAYLEGNLSPNDVRYVELLLNDNDEFSSFVDELSLSEDLESKCNDDYYTSDNQDVFTFELPIIVDNFDFMDDIDLNVDSESDSSQVSLADTPYSEQTNNLYVDDVENTIKIDDL